MKKIVLLYILAVVLVFCCEKQTPEPPLALSEYIIGDWEEREYMDFSAFGNRDFNSVGPPYWAVYSFAEDQTFVLWLGEYPDPRHSFLVNEKDSILTLATSAWRLHSFDENMIDIRFGSTEGPIGKRLYKVD